MYTMLNYPIGSTVLAYDCFTTLFTYIRLNTIYHDDDDDGDDAYITVPRAPNKGNLLAHKWISIVPSLHTRSYIPYKYQRLDPQNFAAVTCQIR